MWCTPFARLVGKLYFLFKLKKQNYGAMHHSLNKFHKVQHLSTASSSIAVQSKSFYKGHDVAMRWLFWVVFFLLFFLLLWNFNQHLIKSASCAAHSWTNFEAEFHQKPISGAGDAECDRQMDGLSHTSPDFIVLFWQTIAHRTSPLTTQHRSHTMPCLIEGTDGSALISACWQGFSLHINTGSAHGCVRLWVCMHVQLVCPAAHHITGNPSFRCCPLLLLCDILIHFDAGPSSAQSNIKTHARTLLQTAGPWLNPLLL